MYDMRIHNTGAHTIYTCMHETINKAKKSQPLENSVGQPSKSNLKYRKIKIKDPE